MLPGLAYAMGPGGVPLAFEAPVLVVPAAAMPPGPQQISNEPPGIGSTGEVNEDGQTTFG